ncbi:aminotransferase class III-fold pyridoxal phosphate-dependent enzyme [Streptomyces sp. NBC_01565]|uniref:aspartate aminotransferase family protein n=1 Tax=Streptomyces sp. NBC_01565 TaxID=2975881 RepID=UPI0022567286|nr:aminotransferase class III-fold pyridoxal phosphate-dependent enzyme [Streptomyces sp. NBC_01565]MCX4543083.1 aminotransferase class III-fold pyridoxal phosphate-dependent enzyme [Streptomyces sp. NBC_01565]
MIPEIEESDLAEPYIGGLLVSLGLSVHFSRAEKDSLFYRDDAGREVSVLDLVGGYGSTIVGHNNPDIVGYAKELLDQGVPVHAQFSKHPYANTLAQKVNAVLRREFATSEPYSAIFANSGAEAVEIAMKHAEFDRVAKLAELAEAIEENLEAARTAVAGGAGLVGGEPFERLGAAAALPLGASADEVIAGIRRVNGARMATAPVFLAPEGSFHGKLVGSVQLTHNPGFRTPFTSLAAQCRFVAVHEPDAPAKAVESERKSLFDLAVDGREVRVVERELPVIAAFVLEPVQGEAGIRPFDRETAQRIRQACEAADVPIIVDEVQSGMGRTGAFFASSHLGLQGDYYTLAKSLGGGIAKAAITLVRGSRYRKEFELVHSSTFAKDAFSTLIADRTVDLLEAEDGKVYRMAAERGERLTQMLLKLRAEFGELVKEVRGKGLMIGLEFHDQSDSPSAVIAEQSRAGLLGYLLSGYLLRVHAVRVLPTASATNTLRLEPSVHITDAEIDRLESSLRALLDVLREQNGAALLP